MYVDITLDIRLLLSIKDKRITFFAPNSCPVPSGTFFAIASVAPPKNLPIAPTVGLVVPNGKSLNPID